MGVDARGSIVDTILSKSEPQGLAQLVRRAHTLSVRGEVTGSSLESFGVRSSVRMADGLPPLPSTNVGKYCWVSGISCFWGSRARQKYVEWILVGCGI